MSSLNLKEASCRLCLETILDKNFEVIDDLTKYIMDRLLLKLKFEEGSKHIICSYCREKLNAALEFKSICLNTDNTIIPYIDGEKMLQVDLKEVYMMEKRSEKLTDISVDQKVCRLCMRLVRMDYKYIHDEEVATIKKIIPEMNTNIVKDPVACKHCFNSLSTHISFLKRCFQIDEKIRKTLATTSQTNDVSPLNLFVKSESLDERLEINDSEMSLKVETNKIKLEEDEEKRDTTLLSLNETSSCEYAEKTRDICEVREICALPLNVFIKTENLDERSEINEIEMPLKTEPIDLKSEDGYECNRCLSSLNDEMANNKCNDAEKYENASGKAQSTSYEDNSKVYKCDMCDYKTKRQYFLLKHQLKHEKTSEVQMYKCNDCDFKCKHQKNLVSHQLVHKDPLQVEMYQCDYEGEQKSGTFLQSNELNMDSSNLYGSKQKTFSKAIVYMCDTCDYRTDHKSSFIKHQLIHKDFSEVQVYKCDTCDYKTKIKGSLMRHQLKHKDFSEVPTYKCDTCDFRTIYKKSLIDHKLIHKDLSEVGLYKCDECDYKTKRKSNLISHQLKHKDSSEVQIYKCDACDFETKYKKNLTGHQLRHKNFPEVQVYQCDACDFKTMHKSSLIGHQLVHKDFSEVSVYLCDTCDYRTKRKSNFIRHQLKHKDCGITSTQV